jgi:Cys-rich protein (TIGR01571 family)
MTDEESCWWGTWCSAALFARTGQEFGITDNKELYRFWAYIIATLVALIFFGPLGFLLFIGIICYYAYHKGTIRGKIRSIRGISGEPAVDFRYHCCSTGLSGCQEAREAKAANMSPFDLCSDQRMSDISSLVEENDVYLSKTSKFILKLNAGISVLIFLIVTSGQRPWNIGILLLAFVQPAAILYFLYWRSRRHVTPLDSVVKMFFVGFWITTLQVRRPVPTRCLSIPPASPATAFHHPFPSPPI